MSKHIIRRDSNHARRWSVNHKRRRNGQIAERDITPDEARVALTAIIMEAGLRLERLHHYDPRKDFFVVQCYHPEEKRLFDYKVRGENVGDVVRFMRIAGGGDGTSKLALPRDVRAK